MGIPIGGGVKANDWEPDIVPAFPGGPKDVIDELDPNGKDEDVVGVVAWEKGFGVVAPKVGVAAPSLFWPLENDVEIVGADAVCPN